MKVVAPQTEAVAGFLIGAGFDAAAYHAGKHHDERNRMQNLFFQNKLRIIVATGTPRLPLRELHILLAFEFT
jgi:superfamily II helicase